MNLDRFLLDALRVAILLGLGLASMPLLRRAPASARRLVLALALGGALVLPAVSAIAPAWHVTRARSWQGAAPAHPVAEPLVEGAASVPATSAPGPMVARSTPPPALRLDPAWMLTILWAFGAIAVTARLAAGLLRARRIARGAVPAGAWARAIEKAERATGIRADVRLSGEIDAPAVTGIVSPVVLVPRASEGWTDARRFSVLLHEIAHVRRRDCLVQVLGQIACAVHWFDPLVWIAARRLRFERELAADDAVLAAGARASSYAEDLLAIAGAHVAPSGALGMAEPSQLGSRVAAILSPEPTRRSLSRPAVAILAGGSALVLFAVACARPAPPAPEGSASAQVAATPPPPPATGSSTIDRRLQRIAEEELGRTMAEWNAAAGAIVVLDPATGEILANAGKAGGAPADVAVRSAYAPGSTLKTITLAAALDEGVVTPTDSFDCENGKRAYGTLILHDSNPNGLLTVPEMLAVSTNVGFSKVFDRVGGERFGRWLRRFHFGEALAVDGAAAGEIPARIEDHTFEGAVVAIGQAMKASPLQMAAAYAVVANGGVYVPPTLSRRAGSDPRETILRPETARALTAMLEEVVNGEHATGKLARISGVRVAGKTGTADITLPGGGEAYYTSFVGFVPAERPRFVILVGVERPRTGGYGGSVAAPAFARIASAALDNGG